MGTSLATLRTGSVELRRARAEDLPALVALLADDLLGSGREAPGDRELAAYRRAFAQIEADAGQLLVVAVTRDAAAGDRVVGTLQLSFIPGLSRRGALRAQIEAVRVRADQRRSGLGTAMVGWAVDEARRRGCGLVQLTTDRSRQDAHRFYERLGFIASHAGLELALERSS